MTATPVAVQPDLEAWVWDHIKDLSGVTSWVYTAIGNWPYWQWIYGLQVDCRAGRKKQARDLAYVTVLPRLLALADEAWADGQITYVAVTEGPSWLPDDPDGAPRYVTRLEYRVHPSRTDPANTGGNP